VIPGTRGRSSTPWAVILIALHSLPAAAAEPVRSVDIVESSAFLEEYRAASQAQRAEFYDLYSDRAVVHTRVQDHARGIAFQGRAFKAWGRQLLNAGRAGLDGSVFSEVTVEQRGIRLLIRARRYATARWYWDPAYQVGIEREGPSYRIVDERLTTNPTARCVPEHTSVNGLHNIAYPPPDLSLALTNGGVRPFDHERDADWRPLSQQELAGKAMQLAQQMAAARAALPQSNGLPAAAVIDTASSRAVSPDDGAPFASARRVQASSDLRVTPQE